LASGSCAAAEAGGRPGPLGVAALADEALEAAADGTALGPELGTTHAALLHGVTGRAEAEVPVNLAT
jgi:hypothetical protein